MATQLNQYFPESVTHPGRTLKAKLLELKMGPKEFAIRTSKPEKTISQIISGESSITMDMAVLFESVLHIPSKFWINRQINYDEAVARLKRKQVIKESVEWATNFPYADMAKMSWVKKTREIEEKIEELFSFFSIANPKAFDDYYFQEKLKLNFRISLSHSQKPFSCAAWLRRGEIQASQLSVTTYDKRKFEESLPEIKSLMAQQPDDFFIKLQNICFASGVKLVYTPCLPGASVNGSSRWIGDSPLIQMSARYKQNDIFWFTFFHEVGHILKHGKKYISLEKVDYDDEEKQHEKEADEFAMKWTFSREQELELLHRKPLSEDDILKYAKEFNTHPAMIIGRFHHKKFIHFSVGRKFIKRIEIKC